MSATGAGTVEVRRCANHPERPAAATCMTCRKVVCVECATRWDGINYCLPCLAARRSSSLRGTSVVGALAWLLLTSAFLFAAVHAITWVAIFIGNLS